MTTQTPNSAKRTSPTRPIVFFDGDCLFCNHTVQTLLAMDDDEQLDFAPLQGSTATNLLSAELRQPTQLGTMVFRRSDGTLATRSQAVIEILAQLGGVYGVAAIIGRICPRPARDAVYDAVARNRHLLARGIACALPAPEDRNRFLD